MQVFSMTMSHFDVGILVVEILQSSCLQTTQEKHVSTINPPKKQHTSYLVISRILGFFPTSEGSKSQVHNLLPSYRSLPPSGNFFNLATNKKTRSSARFHPVRVPSAGLHLWCHLPIWADHIGTSMSKSSCGSNMNPIFGSHQENM